MQRSSPWVPYLLSFVFALLGAAALVFLPETLAPSEQGPDEEASSDGKARPAVSRRLAKLADPLRDCLEMLKQPGLALALAAFLVPGPMAMATSQFLVQYFSKRFNWTLAAAGNLLSLRAVINALLLLLVLPVLSRILQSHAKDRLLAQCSAAALTLGCLLMAGTTASLVVGGLVNTLGCGLAPLCRALAAARVDARQAARLQTLIGVTEALSSLVAGPALAAMLALGMCGGAACMGLPYLALAAFVFLATMPLFFLGASRGLDADQDGPDC